MRSISLISLLLIFSFTKPFFPVPSKTYTYLALGDSYTIGESVPAKDNFPDQTVQLLQKVGFNFQSPEIIAKTGWTTDELQDAINKHIPIAIGIQPSYDFVTLLIGVNNQYRGRTVEDYKPEFESLLKQAIQFARNKNDHVIVLSIPDWGVTPYAEGRDRKKIAEEIDAYNVANKTISESYKVHYIDITPLTREASKDLTLLTKDGLHYSAKEYAKWAEKVSMLIQEKLK